VGRIALIAFLVAGCSAGDVPHGGSGDDDRSCGRIWFTARPPARRRVDLVLSVNGEVCHREPLFAAWRGRITRMCGPDWFAPGLNRVELEVDPPGCAPPVVRASQVCWLPEPD
jgi:hypothetical protein